MMKSRKQRKLEAKQNGVQFVPQYNGNSVVSFEDFYGSGNERFDNKFVKFNNTIEEKQESAEVDTIDNQVVGATSIIEYEEYIQEHKDEHVESELVVEQPKKKSGKFKKALKKLFNK